MSSIHIAERQLANTILAPTDRSIPPEMTITLWAIARNANDIEPAVTVRMAKPLTSGICEARHATSTTSRTATPTVQPWRRANRENWLDGSGSVVTTPIERREPRRVDGAGRSIMPTRLPATRPWAAVSRAFSPASAGSSATIRPPWSTAARSHTRAISRSSLVNISTAAPSSARARTRSYTWCLVPTSMPRVGSNSSITRSPPASQRAIVTFCWLPPESRRTWLAARVSIDSRLTASSTRARSWAGRIGPHLAMRLNSGRAMFSRIERCGSRACRRSAGTSTTPRRMTSKGCRARTGRPSMTSSPRSGLRLPARISNRASWP